MADCLLLLGLKRIDWLLSMSSDKYDAITAAGIEVMQRVPLPDALVPKGATVEITAKIAAGYHTDKVESESIINDLRSLESIRSRCGAILALAEEGKTKHFSLHMDRLEAAVDYVEAVSKATYGSFDKIPYHSRWRHFDQVALEAMVKSWPCDETERARREIDLAFVSVLMDAGAGATWHYLDREEKRHERSEGLAVATMDMFADGLFSSDPALPHRVNAHGLQALTMKQFCRGFQVTDHNPMTGVEGRFGLLQRLAQALRANPEFFGQEVHRPGHVVDYVLRHATGCGSDRRVSVRVLWRAVIEGLESVWPANHSGVRRGDVWSYSLLKRIGEPGSDMVPFHKLSQWLTYSLLEPIESLGVKFDDMHLLTGLAECRFFF